MSDHINPVKKVFDYLSWGFILLFALPTFLIMSSWKSLPGDPMYQMKLGLEHVLLFFVKPSYAAEASLNMKYTQRRLSDTKVLLSNRQSGDGLSYLSQQIKATQAVIDRAPDAATQKALASQYVQTLKDVSLQLDQQRENITQTDVVNAGSQSTSVTTGNVAQLAPQVPTPTVKPVSFFAHITPLPTPKSGTVSRPTSTPASRAIVRATPNPTSTPVVANVPVGEQTQPETVVEQIDTTQDQIQEAIVELERLSSGSNRNIQSPENLLNNRGNSFGGSNSRENNERNDGSNDFWKTDTDRSNERRIIDAPNEKNR